MDKQQAIERIKKSISEGAQIITPKGKSYEEYLAQETEDLLGYVIEPIKVKVTSACHPQYDLPKYQDQEVWAVARSGNDWLLTLSSRPEFALGFGAGPNNIQMLGFSSRDALAEWLG